MGASKVATADRIPTTLEELKRQEKEARRLLIMRAAQSLFAEKGFKGVTVREIAKKAGVSVGTIYNYYTGLDDLFFDIFLDHAQRILDEMERHAGPSPMSPKTVAELYVDYLQRNIDFFQLMSHFMTGAGVPVKSAAKLDEAIRPMMDRLEEVLKTAGVSGNTRIKAHAFLAALNGIMISYARYPGKKKEETDKHIRRLAAEVANLFE